ncbi:MAG TPA: hypothetical protein VFC16_06720 [Nakamurella sp.]|nr:hypothetical protein [Nakamurella sp.]
MTSSANFSTISNPYPLICGTPDADGVGLNPALDEHGAGFGAAVLRAVGVVDDVHADFVHGEFRLRLQLGRLPARSVPAPR